MMEILLLGGDMGAQIKSMQRGNAVVSAGTLAIPLTTAVDPGKSVIMLDVAAVNTSNDTIAGVSGLAASSLTLALSAGSNTVGWAVVELSGVKAVHKGVVSMSTAANNVSAPINVSGIDMSKSLVILAPGSGTTVTIASAHQSTTTYFDYAANSIKRRWSVAGTLVIYYQIIEFN